MTGTVQNDGKFGVNVWWSVPETAVNGERVAAALEAAGFEEKDMPLPNRRVEVSRAVKSLHNRRGKSNTVTDKTHETPDHIVFGILNQEHVDDETVTYAQNTTVRLNKDTGRVSVDGDAVDEVRAAIRFYKGKITDEDIRYFLRRIICMCMGIPKRPSGGIYFVPARFAGIVESAQVVLDELKTGARLYVENVVNGEQERRYVWEAVETSVESEIQKALDAVDRIERSANAVKNHEMKLDGLNEMVTLYRGLLGKEAEYEEVTQRIQGAVEQVSHKMAELQAAAAVEAAEKAAKPKRAAKTDGKSKRAANGQFVDYAKKVLANEDKNGTGMHYREITLRALEIGLATTGKTPENTMSVRLSMAITDASTGLRRVGRGIYALTESE